MTKTLNKKIYTTGQVAKICGAAPHTVTKWFDSGRLGGYRIPGSQDRRIPHRDLVTFLKKYGMAGSCLEAIVPDCHVIFCGLPAKTSASLKEPIEQAGMTPHFAAHPYDAGFVAGTLTHCAAVVIDLSIGRIDASVIARAVSEQWPENRPWVLAIGDACPAPDNFDASIAIHDKTPESVAAELRTLVMIAVK